MEHLRRVLPTSLILRTWHRHRYGQLSRDQLLSCLSELYYEDSKHTRCLQDISLWRTQMCPDRPASRRNWIPDMVQYTWQNFSTNYYHSVVKLDNELCSTALWLQWHLSVSRQRHGAAHVAVGKWWEAEHIRDNYESSRSWTECSWERWQLFHVEVRRQIKVCLQRMLEWVCRRREHLLRARLPWLETMQSLSPLQFLPFSRVFEAHRTRKFRSLWQRKACAGILSATTWLSRQKELCQLPQFYWERFCICETVLSRNDDGTGLQEAQWPKGSPVNVSGFTVRAKITRFPVWSPMQRMS